MDDTQLILNTLRRDGINSGMKMVDRSPAGTVIDMRKYFENHPNGGDGHFSVETPQYIADAYYNGNLEAAKRDFDSVQAARRQAKEQGGIDMLLIPDRLRGTISDVSNNTYPNVNAYFTPGHDITMYTTADGSSDIFSDGNSYPARGVENLPYSGVQLNGGNIGSLMHEFMHAIQAVRRRTIPGLHAKVFKNGIYDDLPGSEALGAPISSRWFKTQFSNDNTKRFYLGYRDMFSPTSAPYYHSGYNGAARSSDKYSEAARAAGDLMWRARGLYFGNTGKHLNVKDPQLMQKAFQLVSDYAYNTPEAPWDTYLAMQGLNSGGRVTSWYKVPQDVKKSYYESSNNNEAKAINKYNTDLNIKGLINKFMEPIPGTGLNRASVTQNNGLNNSQIKQAGMKSSSSNSDMTKLSTDKSGNLFEYIKAIYDSLPLEQQRLLSPRGRFVDSPFTALRVLSPDKDGFAEAYYMNGGKDKHKAFVTIGVKPEALGKGIGKYLLQNLIAQAREKDIRKLVYRLDSSNDNSRKLVLKFVSTPHRVFNDSEEYLIDTDKNKELFAEWLASKITNR